MKLASLNDGSRDGHLMVVSRDLSSAHYATGIASRLQDVLDDWNFISPQLQTLYESLNHGKLRHAFAFDAKQCMAPLPRAGQWAYLGQRADDQPITIIHNASNSWNGALDDMESVTTPPKLDVRLSAIMGDVARHTPGANAVEGVRLLMLTCTAQGDDDAATMTACSAVAVTTDELAPAWSQGSLALSIKRRLNGRAIAELSRPGSDDQRGLSALLHRITLHRAIPAGSVLGGPPWTPTDNDKLLALGDTIEHDIIGIDGLSVFGSLSQCLVSPTDDPSTRR